MITTRVRREGLASNRLAASLNPRTNILEDSPHPGGIELLKPTPEALRRSRLVMAFEFMRSVCVLVKEKNLDVPDSLSSPRGKRNFTEIKRKINSTLMNLNCIFNIGLVSFSERNFFHWDGCG